VSLAYRFQALPAEGELFSRLEHDARFCEIAQMLSEHLGLFRTLDLDPDELAELFARFDPSVVSEACGVIERARSTIAGLADREFLSERTSVILAALNEAFGADAPLLIKGDVVLGSFRLVSAPLVKKGAALLGPPDPRGLQGYDGWDVEELQRLRALYAAAASRGEALLVHIFT
jgi:hypothetical protein